MTMFKLIEPVCEQLCLRMLKQFRVPEHVAFVADGARRFGKKHRIPVQENHEIGLYKVMLEITDWCLEAGISKYSILMYSLGNYYRPPDEVNHWIDIMRIWSMKCIQHWEILKEKGIRLNFFGKLKLIPDDINTMLAVLTLLTKNNNRIVVTMAMGYTGKHELGTVSCEVIKAIRNGTICKDDITAKSFSQCLFTYDIYDVDLMIRTSGYKRTSDFLTWQVSNAFIYYMNVLWPDFSKWNFIKAILYFQQHKGKEFPKYSNRLELRKNFNEILHKPRRNALMKYAVAAGVVPASDTIDDLFTLCYENIYKYYITKCNKYTLNFYTSVYLG